MLTSCNIFYLMRESRHKTSLLFSNFWIAPGSICQKCELWSRKSCNVSENPLTLCMTMVDQTSRLWPARMSENQSHIWAHEAQNFLFDPSILCDNCSHTQPYDHIVKVIKYRNTAASHIQCSYCPTSTHLDNWRSLIMTLRLILQ